MASYLPSGIIAIVIGVTFMGVGSSLKMVVQTQGNDLMHMMQALQKMGGPLGVAIMGSVLSSSYQAGLHAALPPAAAGAARASVFGGLAVAHQLGSASLLGTVRAAFVHGMDVALLVSAGIAAAGMVLTLAFLPWRTARRAAGAESQVEESPFVVTS